MTTKPDLEIVREMNQARRALRIYAAMNDMEPSKALLDAVRRAAASRRQIIGFIPANKIIPVEQSAADEP